MSRAPGRTRLLIRTRAVSFPWWLRRLPYGLIDAYVSHAMLDMIKRLAEAGHQPVGSASAQSRRVSVTPGLVPATTLTSAPRPSRHSRGGRSVNCADGAASELKAPSGPPQGARALRVAAVQSTGGARVSQPALSGRLHSSGAPPGREPSSGAASRADGSPLRVHRGDVGVRPAGPWPDGRVAERLRPQPPYSGPGTSFLEAAGQDFYNTFVLVGPSGVEAGRIRKQTPAVYEPWFFRGEVGSHVIRTPLGTIGVGICNDGHRSYLPSLLQRGGADLVLHAPLLAASDQGRWRNQRAGYPTLALPDGCGRL